MNCAETETNESFVARKTGPENYIHQSTISLECVSLIDRLVSEDSAPGRVAVNTCIIASIFLRASPHVLLLLLYSPLTCTSSPEGSLTLGT